MTKNRNKIIALLVATALACGVLAALSGNSAEQAKQKNLKSEVGSLFTDDSYFSTNSNKSINNQELFFKMMLSVLLVAALGVAAIYVSKKLLPRITHTPGKQIHILETTYLGPKKALHLIEVGNQRLLIGSTNENITTLADITNALAENPIQESTNYARI